MSNFIKLHLRVLLSGILFMSFWVAIPALSDDFCSLFLGAEDLPNQGSFELSPSQFFEDKVLSNVSILYGNPNSIDRIRKFLIGKTWVDLELFLNADYSFDKCDFCTSSYVANTLSSFVASLFIRKRWEMSGQQTSRLEELEAQIRIREFSVQVSEEIMYRIDSRPPSEVFEDEGFNPNPKLKELTVWEHSMQHSGGGGWVSVSYREPSQTLYFQILRSMGFDLSPSIVRNLSQDTVRLYEYRIRPGVSGFYNPKDHGIESENEFIVPSVSLLEILDYREVVVDLRRTSISRRGAFLNFTEISDWRKLQ